MPMIFSHVYDVCINDFHRSGLSLLLDNALIRAKDNIFDVNSFHFWTSQNIPLLAKSWYLLFTYSLLAENFQKSVKMTRENKYKTIGLQVYPIYGYGKFYFGLLFYGPPGIGPVSWLAYSLCLLLLCLLKSFFSFRLLIYR